MKKKTQNFKCNKPLKKGLFVPKSKYDNSKTQNVKELKNPKCDKTQKLKM